MIWDLRDLRGLPMEWLLELTSGGDTLRFAARPLEVGGVRYSPGLTFSGEVEDGVDPMASTPSLRSVDITLRLEMPLEAPVLVEEGFDLASARGRLSLWSPTSDRTELVVAGVVRGVEYGVAEDPITFSLEELAEDDSGLFPPLSARVGLDTWASPADSALGEYYPWILGEPGEGTYPVTPALFVDTAGDRLLVAAHPSEATSVLVLNDQDGTSATVAVAHVRDLRGRMVSLVDLTASGVTIDPEASYFIGWGVAGGGLMKPNGTLLVGAGDVLAWLLGYSRLRIDRGRLAAASVDLNAYRIDTALISDPDERFAPWDWISDHLLPILPVSMRSSSEGFYPLVWRFGATSDQAVAHLEIPDSGSSSPRASLRTSVSYSAREDVANELVLHFRHDPRQDKHLGRKILTGDPVLASAEKDASLNLYCAISRSRYRDPDGLPEVLVREVSSEVVWSAGTASAILQALAMRFAIQSRLVGYTADLETSGSLEPGDVVTVTHPALAWTRKVFLLEEIVRGVEGALDLDLLSVEDAAQTRKKES